MMVFSARMFAIFPTLALLVLGFHRAASLSTEHQPPTNSSTLQMLTQLSEKLFTKLNSHLLSPNRAKARGYDSSWGYLDSYSHDMYGKSDYSWLIPLIIVVGFGTLLIPLMGTLMTTMITQGTINLTAGRRKRSSEPLLENSSTNWRNVVQTVEDALLKFGKHFKQWQRK
ncbi:hypothetical protein TYRP_007935 [Tyrophagus putrescentiae]|nr:hypothetical protein TYRP_007935 [Tyrophagus putrescentiae]